MEQVLRTVLYLFFLLSMARCTSTDIRRERLQEEFPECFVTYDLEVVCEDTPKAGVKKWPR